MELIRNFLREKRSKLKRSSFSHNRDFSYLFINRTLAVNSLFSNILFRVEKCFTIRPTTAFSFISIHFVFPLSPFWFRDKVDDIKSRVVIIIFVFILCFSRCYETTCPLFDFW